MGATFEPWAERLLDAADVHSGERVLDVACGTGIVARLAARRVGEKGTVTGLDLLPGMLDVARRAAEAPAERPQTPVAFCVAEGERSGEGGRGVGYVDDDGLVFPMETHVATASA